MNPDTITIVAGFGRCGSSLMMQMLHAGGMPCAGEFPAFEPPETAVVLSGGTIDGDWLLSKRGHAIKVLDPHRGRIPSTVPIRAIWCDREAVEQAKSQAKLMALMGVTLARDERRAFERSYVKDRKPALTALWRAGAGTILNVSFGLLLENPRLIAEHVAHDCRGQYTLDVDKMAAAVRPRSSACAPDMSMELALIEERR